MTRGMVASGAVGLVVFMVGVFPAASAGELNPAPFIRPPPACPVEYGVEQGPLEFEIMHIATIPWTEEGSGKEYAFVPVLPTLENPLYWYGKVVWQEVCTAYGRAVDCVNDPEGCTSDDDDD